MNTGIKRSLIILVAVVSLSLGACSDGGGASFLVVPIPRITNLSIDSGAVGAAVLITGTTFGPIQGSGTVTFNGITASVMSWSATSVVVTVPTGATSGCVVLTGGGVASNGVTFTVTPNKLAYFTLTGSLNTARGGQTATLLTNEMVLIAGGDDSNNSDGVPVAGAELYNPMAGTFTPTGSLVVGRAFDTATLLNNGMVLIAGGQTSDATAVATAELYDPTTGTFSATGSMSTPRIVHTATLLNNGTVLIAGGNDANFQALASAEIYDPSTGMFTSVGNMNAARLNHTATLLDNDMVLIAGGYAELQGVLASAELYDPASGSFTVAASMNTARGGQTATLLNSGEVLIAGGFDGDGNVVASAELYKPSNAAFAYTGSPIFPRDGDAATLLNNGTVLITGGYDSSIFLDSFPNLASDELYDPVAGTFSTTASLNIGPNDQTATLLTNGTVLVVGGFDSNNSALASAELYDPSTMTPAGLVSISLTPANPSVQLDTVEPLAAIGTFSDASTQTLASASWDTSNSSIATITNDSTNYGHAFAVATGTARLSACAGAICGSAVLDAHP